MPSDRRKPSWVEGLASEDPAAIRWLYPLAVVLGLGFGAGVFWSEHDVEAESQVLRGAPLAEVAWRLPLARGGDDVDLVQSERSTHLVSAAADVEVADVDVSAPVQPEASPEPPAPVGRPVQIPEPRVAWRAPVPPEREHDELLEVAQGPKLPENVQPVAIREDAVSIREESEPEPAPVAEPEPVAEAEPTPVAEPEPVASAITTAALAPPQPSDELAGSVQIQLAAVRSDAAAQSEWKRLKRRYNDLIGTLDHEVVRVDLGEPRGVYYRLRAGPLADPEAARNLCARLVGRRARCMPVTPGR